MRLQMDFKFRLRSELLPEFGEIISLVFGSNDAPFTEGPMSALG
jgi:hypothetical protein